LGKCGQKTLGRALVGWWPCLSGNGEAPRQWPTGEQRGRHGLRRGVAEPASKGADAGLGRTVLTGGDTRERGR
jgi:hypothetical protein